jgi:hypothetical protein
MGISVVLETESGQEVERIDDTTNLLHVLLPTEHDKSFDYLGRIDWYGDTVFNRLQIEAFLAEWERVQARAQTSEAVTLHARIKDLAKRGAQESHLYLKFYGD